ncbi:MAG: sensor histidine kinase [Candidatus Thiodiazotropha sp. (ex Ctena orbiculata)]|uniref:histidine kinase n=1 Tax=Candidatus Thiodiazotropha taylori TaxID=2792791 RepID=A0A944QWR5_9GAMM|nr:sensor histidine kinase [Candidatus Thiodiazotropha taylori]MBT2998149.1 sensor histidine kinase [Candidatus Thiodiazotropha taylori]
MTLVKEKNDLDLVGQSLLTLSVSAISPKTKSANSTKTIKDKRSLIESGFVPVMPDLIDNTNFPSNRINADEEEKKRISRELHDGVGQLLTSMNLHIQRCLDGCDDQAGDRGISEEHMDSLQALSSMVKLAMNEVRTICSSIRPAILDDLGVLAAITWQCRQISRICSKFEVFTDFSIDEADIPEEFKSVIYRIVQESLNNAMKYSQATLIKVKLSRTHDTIELSVLDDGIGFDPSEIKDRLGIGLMSMRERASSVNANLQIKAAVDQGVEISVSFPLKKVALNG